VAKHVAASGRLMVPIAHFSHGARVGSTIHLGAAAGVDADRRLAGATVGIGDMAAQTEQLFVNLHTALEALGGTWQDVVKVRTYIVDWRDLAAYERTQSRYLDRPAASTVGTWGFPLPQILLETELVACCDGVQRFDAEAGGSVRAGALHYCTAAPTGLGGIVATPADAEAQATQALDHLSATLEHAGLQRQDVAMLTVAFADLRAQPAFDTVFRRYFRPPYPARSEVVVPLARPGQLFEIESVAAYGGCQPVGPTTGKLASPGMLAGDWLFVGACASGSERDVEAQTRRAWASIAVTLEEAGMVLHDVIRTNNVLTDWRLYAGFNAGYGVFVTPPYPPRATVHGTLATPGACVQVEAIAHRQGRDATVLDARRR
jgi:enamine deaminase RidA (YjgF/YER057c/UK114 family)